MIVYFQLIVIFQSNISELIGSVVALGSVVVPNQGQNLDGEPWLLRYGRVRSCRLAINRAYMSIQLTTYKYKTFLPFKSAETSHMRVDENLLSPFIRHPAQNVEEVQTHDAEEKHCDACSLTDSVRLREIGAKGSHQRGKRGNGRWPLASKEVWLKRATYHTYNSVGI